MSSPIAAHFPRTPGSPVDHLVSTLSQNFELIQEATYLACWDKPYSQMPKEHILRKPVCARASHVLTHVLENNGIRSETRVSISLDPKYFSAMYYSFGHALVLSTLADGSQYLIDPTYSQFLPQVGMAFPNPEEKIMVTPYSDPKLGLTFLATHLFESENFEFASDHSPLAQLTPEEVVDYFGGLWSPDLYEIDYNPSLSQQIKNLRAKNVLSPENRRHPLNRLARLLNI